MKKPYLIAAPYQGADIRELYDLNEDQTYYLRSEGPDAGKSGWSLKTIQENPNFGWLYFDSLDEAELFLDERAFNIANSYKAYQLIQSKDPKQVPLRAKANCRCKDCGRLYIVHPNTETGYHGEEILPFEEEQIRRVQCFCGTNMVLRIMMSITYDQVE